MLRIPLDRVNWTTSSFLIGTFVLTLTAVPLYLWHFGFDWFHFAVGGVLLLATGFSIEAIYGGYDWKPFGKGTRQIVVGRKH